MGLGPPQAARGPPGVSLCPLRAAQRPPGCPRRRLQHALPMVCAMSRVTMPLLLHLVLTSGLVPDPPFASSSPNPRRPSARGEELREHPRPLPSSSVPSSSSASSSTPSLSTRARNHRFTPTGAQPPRGPCVPRPAVAPSSSPPAASSASHGVLLSTPPHATSCLVLVPAPLVARSQREKPRLRSRAPWHPLLHIHWPATSPEPRQRAARQDRLVPLGTNLLHAPSPAAIAPASCQVPASHPYCC
nr:leucine-rich repeat extensin-like protein 5 [Aegilops tauschii subsp. strangulata]